MKFLLVRPHISLPVARRPHAFLHLEPLDLEIVAGGIPLHHATRILDLTLSKRPEADFAAALRQFQPDVLGFTGYSNQARNVKQLAQLARRSDSKALIVAGGLHATIAPEDYQLPDIIDLVIRGEGATAMRQLTARLEVQAAWPEADHFLPVKSPRYTELAQLPPPELPPYDQIPRPRRELIDRARYHCIWSGDYGERLPALFPRVATMRTSTGCPHRCNFCVVHYVARGKYLQKDPAEVVAEIASIPEDYIYFVDDEMFINAKRMEQIARLLIERGIRKKYISWARSDTICKHVDMFRLWKQAGLALLYVGLESMEEKNLSDYHKGFTPEVNRRAVAILQELGIHLHAALMVNPDFSAEDFLKVRQTIMSLPPSEITFTVFSPSPGTPVWKENRDKFICDDPYYFYDCMHTLLPTRVPLNQFYKFFSLLYLFAFRRNPWRLKKIKVPLGDIARLVVDGALYGWALRRIYRDYNRKYW